MLIFPTTNNWSPLFPPIYHFFVNCFKKFSWLYLQASKSNLFHLSLFRFVCFQNTVSGATTMTSSENQHPENQIRTLFVCVAGKRETVCVRQIHTYWKYSGLGNWKFLFTERSFQISSSLQLNICVGIFILGFVWNVLLYPQTFVFFWFCANHMIETRPLTNYEFSRQLLALFPHGLNQAVWK